MRFVKDWDKKMIAYLNYCPNPSRAILTTYPPGYELPNKIPIENINKPTILIAEEFSSKDGFLRLKSKLLTTSPTTKKDLQSKDMIPPIKSVFWAAGFSFSSSEIIKQVPYDPYLEYLFFGEEISMIVRLFTNGWEFYSPPQSLIFHLWTRSYRSTFQSHATIDEFKLLCSQLRVKLIIGEFTESSLLSFLTEQSFDTSVYMQRITKELEKYGLGTEKTMEEFVEESGVDLVHKVINEKARSGGNEEYKLFFFDNFISNLISQVQVNK